MYLGGKAKWTIVDSLKKALVNVKGNIEAVLSIGIDAKVAVQQMFRQPGTSTGVPGFSVPDLFFRRPVISSDWKVEFGVTSGIGWCQNTTLT